MYSLKMNVSISILVVIIIVTTVYVDAKNLRQTSMETSIDSECNKNSNWTISNYTQKIPKKFFKYFTTSSTISTVKYNRKENGNKTTDEGVRINNNTILMMRTANIIKAPKLQCPNGKTPSVNGQCVDVFMEV